MKLRLNIYVCLLFGVSLGFSQPDPSLILTTEGIQKVRGNLGEAPLFDQTLMELKIKVDNALLDAIDVPTPKDMAGGYTHERHKSNFFLLQEAGLLYQITGDEKYATFVKEILFAYRRVYPTWDRHPEERSYARGKIFWQCLNDANWLVYASQAYDCIYHWLSEAERKELNDQLFRPMADFLSIETPQFFNRIHNHSTWGNAAVGMIGLVMNDSDLVERALYGAKEVGLSSMGEDNDGGRISDSEEMGFLSQIDHAFSPDGYYTEGPYYQRYAMYPFLIFAQALHNRRPELEIFSYKDGVLLRGVYALLNQTNSAGEFFPINDAQKGMSYLSRELTTAVSMAYYYGGQDPTLLSIVEKQERVPLNQTGMLAAMAIANGKVTTFEKSSIQLRDGAKGNEGAIGILRSGSQDKDITLVMKYAKHGMGHGHFDELAVCSYFNNKEILSDYGAARWVNIEQKDGGGYLKENKTWAKQTIAHNTLVVDGQSQFKANVRLADEYNPRTYFFDISNPAVQVMSAIDTGSYDGVKMQRTVVLIQNEEFENPLMLDLYKVNSLEKHNLEYPYHFNGHLMKTNLELEPSKTLEVMGQKYGYEHLWKESVAKSTDVLKSTWFNQGTFYSLVAASSVEDKVVVGLLGANDPNFNLRREQTFILSRPETKNTLFASTVEVHGQYSYVTERPVNSHGSIDKVEVLYNDDCYSMVKITNIAGKSWTYAMSNSDTSMQTKHRVKLGDQKLEWMGPFMLTFNNQNKGKNDK